jgi:WD40 repeat protein
MLFVAPWAPDGRSVARVAPQAFDVFDTFTWQKRVGCVIDGPPLTAATFDPAGRTFVATDKTGLIHFWDTGAWPERTGAPDAAHPPTRTLDWGIGPIQALTFSRDGTLGAVAGSRGDVVVWDVDL